MINKKHPRYTSLKTREKIVNGIGKGITSLHGLIAHGRGEAFDYLLGEMTNSSAKESINAAAVLLLTAKHPVISVNGNAAALVPKELVLLSRMIDAPLEINIFHSSKKRELKIRKHLIENGAKNVFMPDKNCRIKFLESNRKFVNPEGILMADVVFVPLEDGDRTEALVRNGKKVITIDLNPLSRTARHSTITIVDNITRAMPSLINRAMILRKYNNKKLKKIIGDYDNKKTLKESLEYMLQDIP